jgi:predicted nucleic acid-binding Zn ribbon protein
MYRISWQVRGTTWLTGRFAVSGDLPDEADNHFIHSLNARKIGIAETLSPESPEFSTGSSGQINDIELTPPPGQDDAAEPDPAEETDMAAGALSAARAMAAGRPVPRSRLRRARRRSGSAEQGGYSGARPDDRDPALIGSIVSKALPELGWVAPLAEARLMSQWSTVVGSEIAGRCQPVSLVDGHLRVVAESTAWATQLRLMAPQILARITAELPRGLVNKLVITGPAAPSWKHGPWSVRGRGVRDTYG